MKKINELAVGDEACLEPLRNRNVVEKIGRKRKGAGRPAGTFKPESERTESRSVTLRHAEWLELEEKASDGSATKEAARRLRKSLEIAGSNMS